MSNFLLEAKTLSHRFDTLLFEEVNLAITPKESVAIVGRSGSGKSTLLHILSTFLKPDSGEVKLFGTDLYSQKDASIEALRRYDVGIIFQFHYLFKGMSAFENINVASMLSNEHIDEAILEKLEIKGLMKQKISELSGGQQQRVSIARVLSKKPKLIFADEPTGNMDKETASLVMDVLEDYIQRHDAGLLLVTHDESMAKRCSKTYILEEKHLKEQSCT